jgi:chemotaxis protein MotB
MAKAPGKAGKSSGIVIRREGITESGHHGGAWKVAYADFVTAMMAFFLLMWLLNATSEEQRKGLADYFSPTSVLSHNSSGNGQPFGGHTAFDQGTMVSDRGAVQVTMGKAPILPDLEDDDSDTPAKPRPSRNEPGSGQLDREAAQAASTTPAPSLAPQPVKHPDATTASEPPTNTVAVDAGPPSAPASQQSAAALRAEQEKQERQAFEQAAEQIRQAVRSDPRLAGLAQQLAIDLTPEGLRIQILDEDRSPMFATGVASPNERARLLLQKVAPVLMSLPEGISIAGHTDATPYRGEGRSNWELSVERANATRRLLLEAGLPETRVRNVTGNADRDPLLPADPLAAANRRIAIVVLRSAKPPAASGSQ